MATSGVVTELRLSAITGSGNPGRFASGPDGNLWVVLEGARKVVRINVTARHHPAPFKRVD